MFSEFDSLLPNKEDFRGPLSGDQEWKGAAETLNRYPTANINSPILNNRGFVCKTLIISLDSTHTIAIFSKIYIPSKKVTPLLAYKNEDPNKMKQEAKPPNKK